MEALSRLLADVNAAGFDLSAEGDELVVRASRPQTTLTPQVRNRLVAHKAGLLALLRQQQLHDRLDAILADALAKEAEIAKAYETKATVPGDVPPYQRVLAEQARLASVDG